MKVLFAGAEMFPWLKIGGLGDVLGSLPHALRERGLDVRVLLPGFPRVLRVLEAVSRSEVALALGDFYGGPATLRSTVGPLAVPVYVLDAPHLFGGLTDPYAFDGATHRRFAAFACFASHVARFGLDDGYRPDILHLHDWQSALAPVFLASAPQHERVPTVVTVHNLAYQGNFPASVFPELGLPAESFGIDGVEFHGQVSFLKGGLVHATRITTVSPTYADEICRKGSGFGLEGLLAHRRRDLVGILNGIDAMHWDPAREGGLDFPFDVATVARRAKARESLRAYVGLAPRDDAPVFGLVSRLVPEKGIDWVIDALPRLRELGAQLVVLGHGDPRLEWRLGEVAALHPTEVAFVKAYDESLATRIYGGADLLLVPSRYEPCGLTQMYAMRFGAVPLVRRTGGLADTVVDADAPAPAEPTGFVFDEPSTEALARAIERACLCFRTEPARFARLQRTGMRRDFSWAHSSEAYVALYGSIAAPVA